MKLTYINHSGFAIESDNVIILIDYYKDSDGAQNGIVHNQILESAKKLYVLSTHSHHDHFVPQILEWKTERQDIQYVLSKDILDDGMAKPQDAIFLDKLDVYEDKHLWIKAFGSTDKGVSFLIQVDDKKIFHAGDLNNWHWNEEADEEYVKQATQLYETELLALTKETKHLSLAMFPVDPRLGKDYMLGAERFIEQIEVKLFAPMHFDTEYEKANSFAEVAKKYNTQFFHIDRCGQSTEF